MRCCNLDFRVSAFVLLLGSVTGFCLLFIVKETRPNDEIAKHLILEHSIAPATKSRSEISTKSFSQSQHRPARLLLSENSCDGGWYFDGSSCAPCARGTFGRGGALACEACPAGKYSPRAGSSSCTRCGPGKFSSRWAFSCSNCEAGTYSTVQAASSGEFEPILCLTSTLPLECVASGRLCTCGE